MIRRLALAVAETRGSAGEWFLVVLGVAIVLPFAFAYDAFTAWSRSHRLASALAEDTVTCVCGAVTDLREAALRCPTCGVVTVRHAWDACDCGSSSHLTCPCGRPLYNPSVDREGRP